MSQEAAGAGQRDPGGRGKPPVPNRIEDPDGFYEDLLERPRRTHY